MSIIKSYFNNDGSTFSHLLLVSRDLSRRLAEFCPAFELIGKSGKCLKMAVVGGSEAEPLEWCGPPKSQTHQRSALFLYNGKTKAIGQLNFSPVVPILVQMSTSPTNPRMGWGP